ncbi:chaperone protein dnaJ 49-like [Impatiens glandulifera]|uniref:chaperone protein dnaJ 49-like n=1 Tax=Impatiens glandulifera TaxID=253017 RepID=UPI001FB0AA54|nr:chaperone protein dnaJ 49-like [Impatiens glandulifera]
MDGNKDEALKCLKIGRDALDSGDRNRALKFLTKSLRLDPSLQIDDLLSKINNESDNSTAQTKESSERQSRSTGPRKRASTGGSSSSPATYTEEQMTIVRELKKKKDYYEILGLEKNCTVEDIRKAYRKLSLKVHPDKNTAPGSEDCFKSVSKAFQCLSDEEARRKYDVVGSEEPVYERRAARRHQGYYEADIDAEEIFRNFFFGGMRTGNTTHFSTFNFGPGIGVRTGNNNGSSAGTGKMLLQLLPVLLIILVNFLPSYNQPIYQLYRQYPYDYRFTTQKGVNFFVKSRSFEQEYSVNSELRVALEAKVERDYVYVLSQNCENEMQRFRWGFIRETPSCDSLKQFRMAAAS